MLRLARPRSRRAPQGLGGRLVRAVAAARIRATIRNAPGVLGQVTTLIGEAGGNIINLSMAHRQQDFFDVDIDVEVEDARHATMIIAALRANPSVDTVDRARG